MDNKGKTKLLPAVIAFLGVEHAPGSLPSDKQVAKEANKLYLNDIRQVKEIKKEEIKAQKDNKKIVSQKKLKSTKLYKRKAKLNIKNEIDNLALVSLDLSVKRVVKKIKDIKIVSKKTTLAAIKRVKSNRKNNNKVKQIDKKIKIKGNILYRVKEGDTLVKIASLYKTSVATILSLNNLNKNEHIKVGQILKIKKGIKKNIAKNIKIAKKVKKIKRKRLNTIRVTATAYTSHPNQTDKTPFLAAWNNKIRPGMKIIAVSRDLIKKYGLTNGVKVKLKGLPGYYVVRDKMNKRFRNKIDIYMGLNKKKALRWGKRKITISWYK